MIGYILKVPMYGAVSLTKGNIMKQFNNKPPRGFEQVLSIICKANF